MNDDELLKLAKEAGFAIRGREIFSIWREDCELNDELELFAKLIIASCIDIFRDSGEISSYTEKKILNHFGVKINED